MAAEVDYTALTKATGFSDGFPLAEPTPFDGKEKDFWRKVRLDFSKTNLAAADWAKVMIIPAHTYVKEVMTYIVTPEAAAAALCVGDVSADGSVTWVASQDGDVADVVKITLVAATNGATRGKYYHAAGAIYVSATSILDTLVLDVYVHCMVLDPL